MTLEEAQQLAQVLTDDPTTIPGATDALCTCICCVRDYAARLNWVFPDFLWKATPLEEEGGRFGLLVVSDTTTPAHD